MISMLSFTFNIHTQIVHGLTYQNKLPICRNIFALGGICACLPWSQEGLQTPILSTMSFCHYQNESGTITRSRYNISLIHFHQLKSSDHLKQNEAAPLQKISALKSQILKQHCFCNDLWQWDKCRGVNARHGFSLRINLHS